MKKPILIVGIILVFLLLFIIIYPSFFQKQVLAPTKNMENPDKTQNSPPPISFVGKEEIFKNALNLYIQKKQEDLDMTNGPCLGKVAEDWVLDIAHKPRLPQDDKPENQCAEYLSGKAHHFIELDPQGQLIRSE